MYVIFLLGIHECFILFAFVRIIIRNLLFRGTLLLLSFVQKKKSKKNLNLYGHLVKTNIYFSKITTICYFCTLKIGNVPQSSVWLIYKIYIRNCNIGTIHSIIVLIIYIQKWRWVLLIPSTYISCVGCSIHESYHYMCMCDCFPVIVNVCGLKLSRQHLHVKRTQTRYHNSLFLQATLNPSFQRKYH